MNTVIKSHDTASAENLLAEINDRFRGRELVLVYIEDDGTIKLAFNDGNTITIQGNNLSIIGT